MFIILTLSFFGLLLFIYSAIKFIMLLPLSQLPSHMPSHPIKINSNSVVFNEKSNWIISDSFETAWSFEDKDLFCLYFRSPIVREIFKDDSVVFKLKSLLTFKILKQPRSHYTLYPQFCILYISFGSSGLWSVERKSISGESLLLRNYL